MLAEWTAECGDEAPRLVVPWSDEETGLHFVNLRTEPYELAEIAEAEQFPALRRALRSLNGARSGFLTAKCDAWEIEPGEATLEALRLELDLAEEAVQFGRTSYVDLVWRERAVFGSRHVAADRLDRLVRRAGRIEMPEGALSCVLRPALVDLAEPSKGFLEGYAVSLYVTGVGGDAETAHRRWESAVDAVVEMLREREHAVPVGSATIDTGSRAGE